MTTDELRKPFTRMIAGDPDWAAVEASGFLDALVPEHAGGAGLTLAEVGPLIQVLGYHASPLPIADTMVARALLAAAGIAAPGGAIAIATSLQPAPLVNRADHILYDDADGLQVCAADAAPRPAGKLRPVAAIIAATQIAGIAEAMLEMAISHANERTQFGKPIGKFQAIQHQLAVMGEQVLMTRIAAQMGWKAGLAPSPEQAAVTKQVSSAAVQTLASVAHAVHGAIGITEEYQLHRYVKLLYAYRMAHGSESYWARILGAARLARPMQSSVDFVRSL